jgi:serine/threonine-protein kinase HipA
MTDVLYAFLGQTYVGQFSRENGGNLTFSYDEAYRWSFEPTPLSLSLPTQRAHASGQVVENFLDALVPESMAARDNIMHMHGASSTRAFDLLTAIGLDATGALRLSPNRTLEDDSDEIWPISDSEIAQRLRMAAPSGEQPTTANEHWSIAGQQGKIALYLRNGQWFTTSGIARTTHIIKPGIPAFPDQAFDEHFTMSIVRHLGISVAETKFIVFDGVPAIVVTRFDRSMDASGNVKAYHQEDFTQALGVGSSRKYEDNNGPTSQQYAQMLRLHDAFGEANGNIRGFMDGIMVSYVLGATDSHAKNYSVLLQGNQVRLAPLYDMASIFPYLASGNQGYGTTLAMNIGGQRKLLQLRAKHLRRFADRMGMDGDEIVDRFAQLERLAPEAFDHAAEENSQHLRELDNPHFLTDFRERLDMSLRDAQTWID